MAYLKKPNEEDTAGQPLSGSEATPVSGGATGAMPGGGGTDPNAPAEYTQSNALTSKKIANKNQGANLTANLFDDIQKNLVDTGTANDAAVTQFNTDVGAVGQGINFDESDTGLSHLREYGDFAPPPSVDGSKPLTGLENAKNLFSDPKFKTTTGEFGPHLQGFSENANPSSIQYAGTQAGLQRALQNKATSGGQNYGRGMAALDAGIYLPSAGVQSQIGGMLGQYSGAAGHMADQAAAGATTVENAAKDITGRAGAFKGQLQGELNDIINAGTNLSDEQKSALIRQGNAANRAAGPGQSKAMDPIRSAAHEDSYNELPPETQALISTNDLKDLDKYLATFDIGFKSGAPSTYYSGASAARAQQLAGELNSTAPRIEATSMAPEAAFSPEQFSDELHQKAMAWLVNRAQAKAPRGTKVSGGTQTKPTVQEQVMDTYNRLPENPVNHTVKVANASKDFTENAVNDISRETDKNNPFKKKK